MISLAHDRYAKWFSGYCNMDKVLKNNNLSQDQQLFARIAEGDAVAFRHLFDKYFEVLCLNATRLLKSAYWSEEVTQEAMLYIWESRATLPAIEQPAAWIFRVVSNKCLDKIKRQQLEIRAQYLLNISPHEDQPGQLDYALLRKLVAEAVAHLPAQQQAVYKLQQEEMLSYKAIAARLGISANTVRNHLVRAFAAIRAHLISHGEFLPMLFFLIFF
ncbi:RNA polymerase sigma-70 factor [Chitinophaga costaii]|uniref:RNA polymerase sigma-70 factor n=1 Tax=Chitinophaga costaii TaxID=1335309 RepID=UPI00196AAE38|nr:RNA polymerase sigma-70 factor [Chitinophaga costaii]